MESGKDSLLAHFSGTGNSYRVAVWVKKYLEKESRKVSLFPVTELKERSEEMRGTDHLLGIFFPTHAFSPPWPVISLCYRIPRSQGSKAIVIATRGCVRTGNFFLPGSEGFGTFLIALILMIKGYTILGIKGIDMPANFTAFHPGMGSGNVKAVLKRAGSRVNMFMKSIGSGRRVFSGWLPLITGLIFLPLSILYHLIGRPMLAKMYFPTSSCNGCGICAEGCPLQAIRMVGRHKIRPFWTFSCVGCMRCLNYCPRNAVQSNLLAAVLMYYFISAPYFWILWGTVSSLFAFTRGSFNWLISNLVYYLFILVSFQLIYLVLFFLNRIPFLNRVLSLLALTTFMSRYHEPATDLDDLN